MDFTQFTLTYSETTVIFPQSWSRCFSWSMSVTLGELWPALTSSPARMRRPGVKHNACGRT